MKVWDRAGMKLVTPASAVRHVTDCATRPGKWHIAGWSKVAPDLCLLSVNQITVQFLYNTLHYSMNLDKTQSCCGSQSFLPWNFTKEL